MIVHASPGLEVGVYVLVVSEPDRQQLHEDDALNVGLDGRGTLTVEGEAVALTQGQAVLDSRRRDQFTSYEELSVLVVFAGNSVSRRRAPRLAPSLPPRRRFR